MKPTKKSKLRAYRAVRKVKKKTRKSPPKSVTPCPYQNSGLNQNLGFDTSKFLSQVANAPDMLYNKVANIYNPSTPMYPQERDDTCLLASVRMVIGTITGKNISEGDIEKKSQEYPNSYSKGNGTNVLNGVEILKNNGAPFAQLRGKQSIDDLQKATSGGFPVIVAINPPGASIGHAMVIDSVKTNKDGSRSIVIRDPWPPNSGNRKEVSEKEFMSSEYGYSPNQILITTNPPTH